MLSAGCTPLFDAAQFQRWVARNSYQSIAKLGRQVFFEPNTGQLSRPRIFDNDLIRHIPVRRIYGIGESLRLIVSSTRISLAKAAVLDHRSHR